MPRQPRADSLSLRCAVAHAARRARAVFFDEVERFRAAAEDILSQVASEEEIRKSMLRLFAGVCEKFILVRARPPARPPICLPTATPRSPERPTK